MSSAILEKYGECYPSFPLFGCSFWARLIPGISNIVALIVSFCFFIDLIFFTSKDQESTTRGAAEFWFGVIIGYIFFLSIQLCPSYLSKTDVVSASFPTVTYLFLNIPYNSVTLQTARVMKQLSITGHKLFQILATLINSIAYIMTIIMIIYMCFYPNGLLSFTSNLYYISVIAEVSSKIVFILCAGVTFIISGKMKQSTTKKFRYLISFLIFVVASCTFIWFILFIFISQYHVVEYWAYQDLENRVDKLFYFSVLVEWVVEAIPIISIGVFMYSVMNLKPEKEDEDQEPKEIPTLVKGLI